MYTFINLINFIASDHRLIIRPHNNTQAYVWSARNQWEGEYTGQALSLISAEVVSSALKLRYSLTVENYYLNEAMTEHVDRNLQVPEEYGDIPSFFNDYKEKHLC